MATRDELVAVTAERYARGTRRERSLILGEFAAVTGLQPSGGKRPRKLPLEVPEIA